MMNQRQAVFSVISSVFGDIGANEVVKLDKPQLAVVHDELFKLFKSGQVEYRGGCPDDAKLKKYIPGLVNNWMRKDLRLNGGTPYTTKNPGSRQGSGDETVKAMRALLGAVTDPNQKAAIQAEIDARIATLKPKAVINIAALPENLREWAMKLEAERNAAAE